VRGAAYVVLAEVVSRVAGMPLADFARRRIFVPLGMTETMFWSGPEPAPPGAAPLDPVHPAPLSIGDGGLWSTAADLLRWADALNADRLGVPDLVQTPGTLDDGTPLDLCVGDGHPDPVRSPGLSARRRVGRCADDARTRTGERS
jgi:CubicO group peptidase (beta-lactamase class C family)